MLSAQIVLVRHGESAYNLEGRLQGQADPPLTDRGRREAEALAPMLAGFEPGHVLTSDLRRARESAALLGYADAVADPVWREIAVGEWAGRPLAELPGASEPSWRGGPVVPPGGESWDELEARVADAVDALTAEGGRWLVVCHGGVVRAALAYCTGADPRRISGPDNGSVTVLAPPRLRVYAWTPGGGSWA